MKTVRYAIRPAGLASNGRRRTDTILSVQIGRGELRHSTGFGDAEGAMTALRDLTRGHRVKLINTI